MWKLSNHWPYLRSIFRLLKISLLPIYIRPLLYARVEMLNKIVIPFGKCHEEFKNPFSSVRIFLWHSIFEQNFQTGHNAEGNAGNYITRFCSAPEICENSAKENTLWGNCNSIWNYSISDYTQTLILYISSSISF